jgi:hypothetical protein
MKHDFCGNGKQDQISKFFQIDRMGRLGFDGRRQEGSFARRGEEFAEEGEGEFLMGLI